MVEIRNLQEGERALLSLRGDVGEFVADFEHFLKRQNIFVSKVNEEHFVFIVLKDSFYLSSVPLAV